MIQVVMVVTQQSSDESPEPYVKTFLFEYSGDEQDIIDVLAAEFNVGVDELVPNA